MGVITYPCHNICQLSDPGPDILGQRGPKTLFFPPECRWNIITPLMISAHVCVTCRGYSGYGLSPYPKWSLICYHSSRQEYKSTWHGYEHACRTCVVQTMTISSKWHFRLSSLFKSLKHSRQDRMSDDEIYWYLLWHLVCWDDTEIFDEIFVTGCNKICHFDDFLCNRRRKCQNDISGSLLWWWKKWQHIKSMNTIPGNSGSLVSFVKVIRITDNGSCSPGGWHWDY